MSQWKAVCSEINIPFFLKFCLGYYCEACFRIICVKYYSHEFVTEIKFQNCLFIH